MNTTDIQKSHKVIDVADLVASIVSSRDVANQLQEAIDQTDSKSVDLDFAKVDFISRSAAHALQKIKEDLNRRLFNKKDVHFINVNNEVEQMFRTVAATHVLDKQERPQFHAEEVDVNFLRNL